MVFDVGWRGAAVCAAVLALFGCSASPAEIAVSRSITDARRPIGNVDGQAGVPESGASEAAVADGGPLTCALEVAAGGGFNCVLRYGGTVDCWGGNSVGQLGVGTTASVPSGRVIGLPHPIQIATGSAAHACAVDADGSVLCWGDDSFGQLGDGTSAVAGNQPHFSPTPLRAAGLTGVLQVSAGQFHTCAVEHDATVWCWGWNDTGQLGDGTTAQRTEPVLVTPMAEATQVAAGYDHTCALKTDGSVWCWGSNGIGQLGDATTQSRTSPVQVTSLNRVTQIAAGQEQTCAVKADGTVWCWGVGYGPPNDSGTTRFSAVPVQMPIRGAAEQVAVGEVACAVVEPGSVWCWGDNTAGQLGRGTWGYSVGDSVPAPAVQLTEVMEVSVGNMHACARRQGGSIWCWGAPPAAGSAGCTGCREDYVCCPTPSESAPACEARDR